MQTDGADVDAVDDDGSPGRFDQSEQRQRHGALAGAGAANYTHL